MSFGPAKNRTIAYRSLVFDPSLIYFALLLTCGHLNPIGRFLNEHYI